jgi:two-component system, response regulator PdtaR
LAALPKLVDPPRCEPGRRTTRTDQVHGCTPASEHANAVPCVHQALIRRLLVYAQVEPSPHLFVMNALLLQPCDEARLGADLALAGVQVLGLCDSHHLVQDALKLSPDVVVAHQPRLDEALLLACAELDQHAGPAVVVFVDDADPTRMARALRSGVHAYEVMGYSAPRLLAVLQQAQLRARLQRRARDEYQALAARFDERKLVDRAKGILMRARQISEDEAFRILRSASMHGQQRVGQVSQQLITTAATADSINRAGQLRMLSQRRVKLAALLHAGVDANDSQARATDSAKRCAALLAGLRAHLPKDVFDTDLRAVEAALKGLDNALLPATEPTLLGAADNAAEQLLLVADALTTRIAAAGLAPSLHVVNLCGRQRMLSQRLAKQALLTSDDGDAHRATLLATEAEFESALRSLQGLPLSSPDIRRLLEEATAMWHRLRGGVAVAHTASGRRQVADASEGVLDYFEQLTERYERSMQVLMG